MDTDIFSLSEYISILKLTGGSKRRIYSSHNDSRKSYIYWVMGLIIYYVALIRRGVGVSGADNLEQHLLRLFFPLILVVVAILATYDIRKLFYVLHYKSSAWFQNTAYLPSEVMADKGVYGEFFATYYILERYRKNGLDVKIYNGLAIPKRYISSQLVDFSEIDVVAVSDFGVEVYEIKNRAGTFFGASGAETWTQRIGSQTHEMENPLKQNYRHCKALRTWVTKSAKETLYFKSLVNIVLFVSDAEFEIKGNPPYKPGKNETEQWFGNLVHYGKYRMKKDALDPTWVSESKNKLIHMLDHLPKYNPEEMKSLMSQRQRHFESR